MQLKGPVWKMLSHLVVKKLIANKWISVYLLFLASCQWPSCHFSCRCQTSSSYQALRPVGRLTWPTEGGWLQHHPAVKLQDFSLSGTKSSLKLIFVPDAPHDHTLHLTWWFWSQAKIAKALSRSTSWATVETWWPNMTTSFQVDLRFMDSAVQKF